MAHLRRNQAALSPMGLISLDRFAEAAGYIDRILGGTKPRRVADSAADEIQACRQSEDCRSAGPGRSVSSSAAGRRGDRVRSFVPHESGIDPIAALPSYLTNVCCLRQVGHDAAIAEATLLTQMYGPAVCCKSLRQDNGEQSCINVSAFDWSVSFSGHHGYQRACDLISGQTSTRPFGSPVFTLAGRPNLHLFSSLADTQRVRRIDLATSSRAPHFARPWSSE